MVNRHTVAAQFNLQRNNLQFDFVAKRLRMSLTLA
jgi:hypothetical protein